MADVDAIRKSEIIKGIRKGNVGEAVLGGAGGYFTGATGKGLTQALTKPAARMAGGMGLQNLLGTAAGQIKLPKLKKVEV